MLNLVTKIVLDKVTLNVGVGGEGEPLENALALLERITGQKPAKTKARSRNPTFNIRKGDFIGTKVTLRGAKAKEVLSRAVESIDSALKETSFDANGNLSFGIKEYIDFPGMKYDPKIGMMGFDVSVTLVKPGVRVARRRIASRRLSRKQRVSKEEAQDFMKTVFKANIVATE